MRRGRLAIVSEDGYLLDGGPYPKVTTPTTMNAEVRNRLALHRAWLEGKRQTTTIISPSGTGVVIQKSGQPAIICNPIGDALVCT